MAFPFQSCSASDPPLLPFSSALSHLFFFFLLLFHPDPSFGGPLHREFIYPNFTASNFLYIDTSGAFLTSPNTNFKAAIFNPGGQQSRFYLCVIHKPTNSVVWSANRAAPVSSSGLLLLTSSGLSLSQHTGDNSNNATTDPAWSTPSFPSPVTALRLLDSGNLLLLDASNASLWQSFDHPSDVLLLGQPLPAGAFLASSLSDSDLSEGYYRLLVTAGDAVLRWSKEEGGHQQYWSLSSDPRYYKNSNAVVSYLEMNATGLYLFSGSRDRRESKAAAAVVVFEVLLSPADFRIGQLDSRGQLTIQSYVSSSSGTALDDGFVVPSNDCDLPLSCSTMGLCTPGTNSSVCTCPPGFVPPADHQGSGCVPAGGLSLADPSSSCSQQQPISYLGLGAAIGYPGNKFAIPTTSGNDFPACQSLCSGNCSCLGFYYANSTRSCYLLEHQLGSVFRIGTGENNCGYIKTVGSGGSSDPTSQNSKGSSSAASNVLPIVLPSIAVFLLLIVLAVLFVRWRRLRRGSSSMKEMKLGRSKPPWPLDKDANGGDDEDDISIPGLPTRFTYEELEAATNNFRTRIGSGGFGEVFKGELADKSEIAVKRISNLGVQGKKEFCTEIAVIGNIHHVNLVKLRGFCAQGMKRLLVYEYMNRSSLDRSLFSRTGPALEWQERVEVALGTARGLAYLHGGCDHKIIHCDVKPENILLHDHSMVKIADFGLSKLLTPEQSGLFTTMRGTRGYLAPEWLTNSSISDRTDVYSFGMVLLEIIRGRKNCAVMGTPSDDADTDLSSLPSPGSGYFPLLALEMHEQGRYLGLADPRLEGRVVEEELGKIARIALCCLHEEPGRRPSMAAVVGMLEGAVPVWDPRRESLNFLRFYGRGSAASGMGGITRVGGGFGDMGSGGGVLPFGRGNYISTTSTGSTTSTSPSIMSSQQVSGPR